MEQAMEQYTTVYTTIDDLIGDLRLSDLLEAELGHAPDRDQELALAHACAEYSEDSRGFVLKPGFGPDEQGSLDNWKYALAEADEPMRVSGKPVLLVEGVCGSLGEPKWAITLLQTEDGRYFLRGADCDQELARDSASAWIRHASRDTDTGMMEARGGVSADADALLQETIGVR